MASADEYAAWIVQNRDKAGSPEFSTVARAYEEAKTAEGASRRGFTGDIQRGAASGAVAEEQAYAPAREPSNAEFVLKGLGQGLRAGYGAIGDLPQNLGQLGMAGAGFLAGETLRPDVARPLMPEVGNVVKPRFVSRLFQQLTPFLDAPPPQNDTQQMLLTGGQTAGMGMIPGARAMSPSGFTRNVALPAIGAAVGEQLGGEPGKALGGIALPAAAGLAGGAVVGGLTPSAAEKVVERIKTFDKAEMPYTLADVGNNRTMIQGFFDKLPIASGVAHAAAETQRGAGLAKITKMLGQVGGDIDNRLAGMRIEEGLRSWKSKVGMTQAQLEAQAEHLYPKATMIPANNTLNLLTRETAPIAGAPNTGAALQDPQLGKMLAMVGDDLAAQGGNISYEGLDTLRKRVGDLAFSKNPELIGTSQQATYQRLYNAINADIIDGAAGVSDAAARAVARKNAFWQGVKLREENYLSDVFKKADATPDTVVRDLVMARDSSKLRAVMKSVDGETQDAVVANVIGKMGNPTPGKATGEYTFSLDTLLTNYNRMTPEAKQVLLSRGRYAGLKSDIDAIAEAVGRSRDSGRAFANPSGSGQIVGNVGAFMMVVNALGDPSRLAKAGIGLAGGATIQSLATSPAFIRGMAWLARHPGENAATGLARLNASLGMSGDPEIRDAGQKLMKFLSQEAQP